MTGADATAAAAWGFLGPGLAERAAARARRRLPRLRARVLLFIAITWVPLAALSWMDGRFTGQGWVFTLDMATYARFLLAGPVLVGVGLLADRELVNAVASWRAAELVPRTRQQAWDRFLARLQATRRSPVPSLLCLVLAYGLTALALNAAGPGRRGSWVWGGDAPGPLSWAGWWYALVSAPLLQYAALRWLWRFVLWTAALVRLATLPVHVLGTHADQVGGLDAVAKTHNLFAWFVLAQASVEGGAMANEILHMGASVDELRIAALLLAGLSMVVFVGPLVLFTPSLVMARRRASARYGTAAAHHAAHLEERIEDALAADPHTRPLLDSDLLEDDANLAQSFASVRDMRLFVLARSGLLLFALAAAGPLLLAGLTQIPAVELLKRLKTLLL